MKHAIFAAILIAAAVGRPQGPPLREQGVPDRQLSDARRLVAVGDIHGDFPAFTAILKAAGIGDEAGKWTGGNARFVQTGDYLDRGVDVRRVMDLLRRLETAAPRAGGRVHVLLGNHEVMNLLAEFRDVNPAVYATFADRGSEARRERAYAVHARIAERRARALGARPAVYDVTNKDAWMAAHPPGFLEHAAALRPDGEYGRWLRRLDAAVVIDGSVLMHAGLQASTAPASIDALNTLVRTEIQRFDAARAHLEARGQILPFFTLSQIIAAAEAEAEAINAGRANADERHAEALTTVLRIGQSALLDGAGPLWFRGFATWTEEEGREPIQALLAQYQSRRFVTGHSVQGNARINSRFDHRVFLIDTGMLTRVYKGRPSALEVSGARITAVYPDGRDVLVETAPQRAGADR